MSPEFLGIFFILFGLIYAEEVLDKRVYKHPQSNRPYTVYIEPIYFFFSFLNSEFSLYIIYINIM